MIFLQVDSTGNAIQCARKFDPENNPSNEPKPKKSEEISLLIATDVLAEGVNLQAGQVIINYDFHWNPTRLIQRAGRVDRIGSKNEFVTVHNFLLDPRMEDDFHLEYSVDNKIDNIQKIIGEDIADEVRLIDFVEGKSSTSTIKKIRRSNSIGSAFHEYIFKNCNFKKI